MEDDIQLQFQNLEKSATLAINEQSSALEQDGQDIIKFGFGQSPFPVPETVVDTLKVYAHRKEYISVEGLPELRSTIAGTYSKELGTECDGSQVFIGPGTKELMFLLQMIHDGETIISTPSWVSYSPQASMLKRKVSYIHTSSDSDWLLSASQLDDELKKFSSVPKLLILNYPGNPSGTSYKEKDLIALAETARKHKILILSDEIYGRLNHEGNHRSIAEFYPEGTIISSGLSKWCGAGGWRLGHFLFPKKMKQLMQSITAAASETFSCVSAPIQFAAVRAYQADDSIKNYQFHTRRVLKLIGQYSTKKLNEGGIKTVAPTGGFYLFPDFSDIKDSFSTRGISDSPTLCKKLLEDTGVALLPGSAFFRNRLELTARLAYVTFDGAKALQKSAKQPSDGFSFDHLNPTCNRVVEGIDRIIDWIHQ
jgi:aspartate aminotransferase